MKLPFGVVADEVLHSCKAEAAEHFIFQPEGLLFAGDLFQQAVDMVDLRPELVDVGMRDEFITALSFESDVTRAREGLFDPFQAFEAHLHQFEQWVEPHLLFIADQLRQAAKAGETRVTGTRARGDESALHDGDAEGGGAFFQVVRAPQTYQAAAGDDDVGGCEERFLFPDGERWRWR